MTDTYDHLKEIGSGSGLIDVKLRSAPDNEDALTPNARTLSFDGRGDPLGYWGEGTDDQRDRSYLNPVDVDGDMWEEMQLLLALKAPVQWEGADGDMAIVQVTNARRKWIEGSRRKLQRITFHLTKLEDDTGS